MSAKRTLPRDELTQQYEAGATLKNLRVHYNCNTRVLIRNLKEAGVRLRTKKAALVLAGAQRRSRVTPRDRYLAKIDRDSTGCHEWTAARNADGYGLFRTTEGSHIASRFGYELFVGLIPDGLHVLHKCDNPPCQNPDHWFLGTIADNNADRRF